QSVMDTALTNAGISSNDVTVTVGELSKTKATTDAAGSIGGSISIVSKADADVSDSVPVDKTIDRLPVTDEEKVEAAKKVVQEALAGITVTNDTTKDDIQNVIDNALRKAELTDVTVTVEELSKTEATAEEEGSIGGSISIVSKGAADVSGSVPVEKTIAPLPETNEEKVAAAKKVVQEALSEITAANDTTKEDIQNVIDNALSKAGLTDVTVTVGELDKTEATTEEAGSISGNITIVSKEDADVSDHVPVGKTIARLPETNEEKVAAAKKIVQEVLAGITATNDTTGDDIQNAIDYALGKVGLVDVTVIVGELDKAEATTEEAGSISGSITIVSKEDADVSDSVPVGKTIARLPKTDEEKVAAAKKVVQEALAGITATNDITKDEIQNVIDNALDKAGLADVTVTVGELDKTEATTKKAGSISGNIDIACGTASGSVPVGKTIAQLPATDAGKVEAAKKVVQEALSGITATNEITRDEIQSVIDLALEKAGLAEDVTVILDDLVRTEATTSEPGSISGNIAIVCGTADDSVPVNKTIAQLPKTPEEKVAEAKAAVEEALAGITVTTDTTKEDIQKVIDAALSDAGITDVTVTVADLVKTDATTEEAGSIRGSITIGSREDESVSVRVPITVIIDRLLQDKPDVSEEQEKPDVSDKQDTPAVSDSQPVRSEQPSGSGGVSNAARPENNRNDSNGSNSSNSRRPQTVEQAGQEAGPSEETDNDKPVPGGEMGQTISVSLDQDKAVITGELTATGNVQGMAGTSMGLKLGDGMVIVTVVCEEQEYTAGVADTVAVANAVLTPEQIQSVNDGETIEIRVDVKDISQNMPASDKEVIESGVEEYRKGMPELTLGMYVDISVFIRVGTGGWDAVTSTREPVEVVIGIPEELREEGREFYIIRSHEGEYAFLEDTDGEPDTITISTDRFSAYAIAYRQTDGREADRCGLCHICPTFLGICCFIWLAVFLAAVLVIVWISLRRMRKESRKRP
ncbi:MAG: hypothetical protein K2N01_12340, partial [Lachnospiraceae bacterium]|nr:hypothetical protein [Lachnospiraceae bacterium]